MYDFHTIFQEEGDVLAIFPGVTHQGGGIVCLLQLMVNVLLINLQGGINLAANISYGKLWFSVHSSIMKIRKNGVRKAANHYPAKWETIFSKICSMLDTPGVVLMWVCNYHNSTLVVFKITLIQDALVGTRDVELLHGCLSYLEATVPVQADTFPVKRVLTATIHTRCIDNKINTKLEHFCILCTEYLLFTVYVPEGESFCIDKLFFF